VYVSVAEAGDHVERSAVIFDLDGTLTRPILDFDAMRAEIGGVTGPILEAMASMSDDARRRAEGILARHELLAAQRSQLYDGAVDLVDRLRRHGFGVAILTRNSRRCTRLVLAMHGLKVDALRTREDGAVKPSAEPVLALCRQLGAAPGRSWMVGDYHFDILSGAAAGTRTILMIGEAEAPAFAVEADFVVRRLGDVWPIVTDAATNETCMPTI